MQLRSPAEFYIKYLVVKPENLSDQAIENILKELELDFIDTKYITALRERTTKPVPFYPKDRLHSRSQRFILKEGLHSIFFPDVNMKAALRVLETPRAKEFVEAMLLSRAPSAAIAGAVRSQRGIDCSAGAIDKYRHYFWNIDLLSSTQMRTLLIYRQELVGATGENASKQDRALHNAAKKAGYMDARRIASELPNSPMTALMTQMRMGAMPGKVELAKLVQMAQAFSIVRTAEATMYNSVQDSQKALNFSHVARNMTDILEKVVKPDEHLHEGLRKIGLRTDPLTPPTVHQLSDGSHTVDLQPPQVQNDDGEYVAGGDEEVEREPTEP